MRLHDSDFLPPSENGLLPPEAAPGIPMSEYDFDRLLVFYNPVGNVAAAKAQIGELAESRYSSMLDVKTTVAGGHEANMEHFAKHVRLGDVLVLATGDGTQKTAIQTVAGFAMPFETPRRTRMPFLAAIQAATGYTELSETLRHTPILPLGGGNANDLDVMLNDSRRRVAPSEILESGRIVTINPIRCHLDAPGFEPYEHFAGSYATVGVSARAAYALNQRQYRESALRKVPGIKRAHEFAVVGRELQDARPFTISEDGVERRVGEILFTNGGIMAKYCRFPSRLTERGVIYHAEVADLRALSVARSVGGLLMNRLAGDFQDTDRSFTALTTTFVQFDGEAELVHPGTTITVGPAQDVAFHAITTRVRP